MKDRKEYAYHVSYIYTLFPVSPCAGWVIITDPKKLKASNAVEMMKQFTETIENKRKEENGARYNEGNLVILNVTRLKGKTH